MHLELPDKDVPIVRGLLERYLSELQAELVHSEQKELRRALIEEMDAVDRLAKKLVSDRVGPAKLSP